MHYWGDDWEHWDTLYKAIDEIDNKLRKARIRAYTKEKYGTMRVDMLGYWDGTIYGIFYYNYCYIKKNWRWFYFNIDLKIMRHLFRITRVVNMVHAIQNWYLRKTFKTIIKKYPEIKEELLFDINYRLKDGLNI